MLIKKLFLQTAYLKTLQEFYSSILELAVKEIDERQISIAAGRSDIIFEEADKDEPFYHFAFNIPANKIGEAKEWLSNKVQLLWMDDYKNDIADFVNWHARSVYFFDPAGNIVELIARFDLKNESNEPFSSKQFLSISEVGLVFNQNDFEAKTMELQKSYSLPYFSKQPPLPQFRAIGDDEGLFIVVPESRNWYPTNKAARIFQLIVQIDNDGHPFVIESKAN